MKLDVPLRRMFAHPVDTLLAAMPDAEDALWARFSLRQTVYPMHRATRSIVLNWRGETGDGEVPVLTFDYAPSALRDAMAVAGEAIRNALGGGRIVQLVLTELPAGASVKRHVDAASVLTMTHRCHLPVATNDDVAFVIDGVDHRLAAGHVYEFDNTRPHAVFNRGADRRVHLICDVLPD